eukprot:jgi/Ulvmu1/7994/UM004_0229.1
MRCLQVKLHDCVMAHPVLTPTRFNETEETLHMMKVEAVEGAYGNCHYLWTKFLTYIDDWRDNSCCRLEDQVGFSAVLETGRQRDERMTSAAERLALQQMRAPIPGEEMMLQLTMVIKGTMCMINTSAASG